jgi:hypothetical protein
VSKEIKLTLGESGLGNVFACVFKNDSGVIKVRDTTNNTWDTPFAVANLDTYDIPLTEFATGSGLYVADFPASITEAGRFIICFYLGTPAASVILDYIPAIQEIIWSGTADVSDSLFVKAAKVLVNKAVQIKSTGVINYYDDDGSTVLLTHTPTDAETTITRTPS